jgi:hypothetical protein
MKNITVFLSFGFAFLFNGCTNESVEMKYENIISSDEIVPMLNYEGTGDSINADGFLVGIDEQGNLAHAKIEEETEAEIDSEELNYKLGPIPENAYQNIYGEDSVDVNGNYVFPPRDTIYLDEE